MYKPDNWVIIHIGGDDPHYRVLAGWSSGYAHGSSWRMNSGITDVTVTENAFDFFGTSGSVYTCAKSSYGLRMNNAGAWRQLQDVYGDSVTLMPEETDWRHVDWSSAPAM